MEEELFFFPKKNIIEGSRISKQIEAKMFMEEKTVSLKPIVEGSWDSKYSFEISSLKCPFSATFIKDDPDIPPCQIINPEYPAAPTKA